MTCYLTERAHNEMVAQGRLRNGYLTVHLVEPGGAFIEERVAVRETAAWDFDRSRDGTPWVYIPKEVRP